MRLIFLPDRIAVGLHIVESLAQRNLGEGLQVGADGDRCRDGRFEVDTVAADAILPPVIDVGGVPVEIVVGLTEGQGPGEADAGQFPQGGVAVAGVGVDFVDGEEVRLKGHALEAAQGLEGVLAVELGLVLEAAAEGFEVAVVALAIAGGAGVEFVEVILIGDDVDVEPGLPHIGKGVIGFAADPVAVVVVVGIAGFLVVVCFRGVGELVVKEGGGKGPLVGGTRHVTEIGPGHEAPLHPVLGVEGCVDGIGDIEEEWDVKPESVEGGTGDIGEEEAALACVLGRQDHVGGIEDRHVPDVEAGVCEHGVTALADFRVGGREAPWGGLAVVELAGDHPAIADAIGVEAGLFDGLALEVQGELLAQNGGVGELARLLGQADGSLAGEELLLVGDYMHVAFGLDRLQLDIVDHPVGLDSDRGLVLGGGLAFHLLGARRFGFLFFFEQLGPGRDFLVLRRPWRHLLVFFEDDAALGDDAVRVFIADHLVGRDVPFFRGHLLGPGELCAAGHVDEDGQGHETRAAEEWKTKVHERLLRRWLESSTVMGRRCRRGVCWWQRPPIRRLPRIDGEAAIRCKIHWNGKCTGSYQTLSSLKSSRPGRAQSSVNEALEFGSLRWSGKL